MVKALSTNLTRALYCLNHEALSVIYHMLIILLFLTICRRLNWPLGTLTMLDFTTGCEIGAGDTVSIVYVAGAPSVPLMTALSSNLVTTFEVLKAAVTDRIWTLCLKLFLVPIPTKYKVFCDFRAQLGSLELFSKIFISSISTYHLIFCMKRLNYEWTRDYKFSKSNTGSLPDVYK